MKILLLILITNLISISLLAQHKIIYAVFGDNDLSGGLRYDQEFKMNKYTGYSLGCYGLTSYGVYNTNQKGHVPHLKASAGMAFYNHWKPLMSKMGNIVFAGLNYHYYDKSEANMSYIPKWAFTSVSFEVGAGIFTQRFAIEFTYDPIKKDASIGIGIVFK